MRAVTDRVAVRLGACALFIAALAGMVWWGTGFLAHL
jgi:hypothetical protein